MNDDPLTPEQRRQAETALMPHRPFRDRLQSPLGNASTNGATTSVAVPAGTPERAERLANAVRAATGDDWTVAAIVDLAVRRLERDMQTARYP